MTILQNIKFVGAESKTSLLNISYPEEQESTPLLLFAHGFKGFKDWGHFPTIVETFSQNGFCVVSFNFSHNGGTVENPIDFPDLVAFSENTYSKEIEDIEKLLEWIHSHKTEHFQSVNLNEIYLLGHSRGGGIAMLAGERFAEIKKIVSWAGVSDFIERIFSKHDLKKWEEEGVYYVMNGRTKQNMPIKYSFVEDLINNRETLSIKTAVQKLKKPLLVIHGKKDETVNYSEAEDLKSWNTSIELELIEEANHTFNGKHPWNENELPEVTKLAIQKTVDFLKT